MNYFVLFLALMIRTVVDLCFKISVNHLHLDSVEFLHKIIKVLKSPFLWLGLFLSFFNLGVWSLVLKYFDLSYAYPLFSLSYVFVIISGKLFFGEHLDKNKMIGIVFITLGVLLLFIE